MATATTPKPRKARKPVPTTFRLLLAIGSTVYWVRPITSTLHSKACRLRRADGKGEYFVTQDQHGHHCDCGDHVWRHEGNGTACKHVKSLRACRLLDVMPSAALVSRVRD